MMTDISPLGTEHATTTKQIAEEYVVGQHALTTEVVTEVALDIIDNNSLVIESFIIVGDMNGKTGKHGDIGNATLYLNDPLKDRTIKRMGKLPVTITTTISGTSE